MTIFFTSDTHFGHRNIIKYCDRPYVNEHDMDMNLIANWNARVSDKDTIYHVGDVSMDDRKRKEIVPKLNGKKHLIKGNHDKRVTNDEGWESISNYKEVYVGKQMIVLFHYAMRVWNKSHRGSWHLYGHSHGTLIDPYFDEKTLSFDIGVDSHGYKPLNFDEVAAIMNTKNWEQPDLD